MMDEKQMNKIIADYLPTAMAGNDSCPPVEIWAAVVNRDIPDQSCRRLEQHAGTCRHCCNELELARQFLDQSAAADDDVAWIVDKLQHPLPEKSNVVRLSGRWRRYTQPLLGLAAAAMLMIAFAPLLPLQRSEPVLVPPENGHMRGSEVFVLQPVGELTAFADRFEWRAHNDANSYHLSITAVDGVVVWDAQTKAETSIVLPDELLQRYVVYYWQVEALDVSGAQVAQSRKIRFRVSGAAP